MKNRFGLTLIEIIFSILIITAVIYSALALLVNSGLKSVNVDVFVAAQSLAEGKMEKLMGRAFETVSDEGAVAFTGELSGFSARVFVDYVSGEALSVPVLSATGYKKIIVEISQAKLSSPLTLESIRGNY